MTLLLDTHALLWWLADEPALTPVARTAIRAAGTLVFVSATTAWEISIKQALGKLEAPDDLEAALAASRFQPLPITVAHAIAAGRLPRHHDDPLIGCSLRKRSMPGSRWSRTIRSSASMMWPSCGHDPGTRPSLRSLSMIARSPASSLRLVLCVCTR